MQAGAGRKSRPAVPRCAVRDHILILWTNSPGMGSPHAMRSLLFSLVAVCLACVPCIRADEVRSTALTAADTERVAAMKSADREKLAAILSDDLRYAHSSGTVDTKQSFIESLTTGRTKYLALDYEERAFTFPAPGIALMTGRAHVKVANATGEADMMLSFLSVWREEHGKWRFLAWQSCKLPAPGAAK